MDSERGSFLHNGRDIAAAWAICAILAVLGLALISIGPETTHTADLAAASCGSPAVPTCPVSVRQPQPADHIAGAYRINPPAASPAHVPHG